MKMVDIRAMTPDQRKSEVMRLRREQLNLRFQKASGTLENTAIVRRLRRDIARLKTAAK